MTVCPKYKIAFGSDEKARNIFWLAADATRKVVNKTVGENVVLFTAKCNFRTFGPTYDLEFFRLADVWCISFFKNIGKHSVCDALGPP